MQVYQQRKRRDSYGEGLSGSDEDNQRAMSGIGERMEEFVGETSQPRTAAPAHNSGLTVGNRPVIITAAPDYQLPDSPAATMFQAKHVNAAERPKDVFNAAERPKDVFRSLVAKALEKYTELKTYYSQLPLKDGSNEMFYKTVKKYPALDSYVPDFEGLVHAH